MIIALIIGFITGWAMSMPIGPLNAAIIGKTLKVNYKLGLAVGIGAAIMDVIYCGGAAEIHQFLIESPIINLIFQSIGFILLVFLGIRMILHRNEEPPPVVEGEAGVNERIRKMNVNPRGYVAAFLLGLLLYASNVAAVPEWIFVSALWRSWGLLETGFSINAFFALGAGLGTAGWFLILVRWIHKRRRGFTRETLMKINYGSGIALLIFGVYFGYQIVFNTNWSSVNSHWRQNTGQL